MNSCSAITRRALLAGVLPIGAAQAQPARPSILATTAMVAELARGVGGDAVTVDSLIGEGVDPHLFRPTRSDISRLLRADAILANGHRLEGRMGDVLERARTAGRPVVAVGEAIPPARLRTHPDYADAADPHLWMDPLLWAECAAPVAALLARLVPRMDVSAGLGRVQADYARLDAYARAALAPIPQGRRILVTAHDAFGYFGARYELEVRSIQGLSTEAEASLSRIEALVTLMVERRVPAIFAETSVPDRAVRALIEGAAARGHQVALGGSLFSDSMGRAGTYAGTYGGMMDHNITTIATALGGNAPRGGMAGAVVSPAMPLPPAPLAIEGLTVAYGGRPALRDVTWNAQPGLTAILGPNGAGKSTLLKAALGLIPRETGEVRFFGAGLESARSRVAYLPQRASVDWDFPATALDVVAMARVPRMRWWGRIPRADRAAALAALDAVGLGDYASRQIGRLSGGQQQRVFLARALAQEAELFLMDEPLAAVDAVTERTILGVLHGLAAEGKSVLMVHHDLSLITDHFTHVLLLAGRVVAAGPVREAFTEESVARAFGGLPEMRPRMQPA